MTSLPGLQAALILLLAPMAHAAAQGPGSAPAPEGGVLLGKATAAGQLRPREAADAAEQMLALDSLDVEANWRAAIAYVDLGKVTPDDRKDRVRDSFYLAAEAYARRAVRLAPRDANAHFALATALGKAALTQGEEGTGPLRVGDPGWCHAEPGPRPSPRRVVAAFDPRADAI